MSLGPRQGGALEPKPWRKSWRKRWLATSSYRRLSLLQREILRYVEENADDTGAVRVSKRYLADICSSPRERVSPSAVWRAVQALSRDCLLSCTVDTDRKADRKADHNPWTLTRVNFKEYQEAKPNPDRDPDRKADQSSRGSEKEVSTAGKPADPFRVVMAVLRAWLPGVNFDATDAKTIRARLRDEPPERIIARIFCGMVQRQPRAFSAAHALSTKFRLTLDPGEVSFNERRALEEFNNRRDGRDPGNAGAPPEATGSSPPLGIPPPRGPEPAYPRDLLGTSSAAGNVENNPSLDLGAQPLNVRIARLLDRARNAPGNHGRMGPGPLFGDPPGKATLG